MSDSLFINKDQFSKENNQKYINGIVNRKNIDKKLIAEHNLLNKYIINKIQEENIL